MKYLKEYAESGYESFLSEFGIDMSEFKKMVDFLGDCYYGDVKDVGKYIGSWNAGNRVPYDGVRKMISKYKELRQQEDKFDVIREMFLDMKENDDVDVLISKSNGIELRFEKSFDKLLYIMSKIKTNLDRLNIKDYTLYRVSSDTGLSNLIEIRISIPEYQTPSYHERRHAPK